MIESDISALLGKVLDRVEVQRFTPSLEDAIRFHCSDGQVYVMTHEQECCENVEIEDINGDIDNLTGSIVLVAEESSNESDTNDGSETWTFYRIATAKGWVDIRWYGTSNGYYSERVSFSLLEAEVDA